MNINHIFNLTEDFFTMINPNFCDDCDDEIEESELWKICEDFFEQMGQQF